MAQENHLHERGGKTFNAAEARAADARLASRLAQARHDAGLSQEALARAVGCSASVVPKWEAGNRRPSLPMLRRLADALGVTLGSLVE